MRLRGIHVPDMQTHTSQQESKNQEIPVRLEHLENLLKTDK
jgi:hypothetical protein